MAHKKKFSGPVPPGNQQHGGPPGAGDHGEQESAHVGGPPDQEQDPKRRLGDYTGKGEQSFKQPGGLNDANH